MTKMRNDEADWNWPEQAHWEYLEENYGKLIPEDRILAEVTVDGINEINPDFGTRTDGLVIGFGGSLRGAAAIAPLMAPREQGGEILLGDIGDSKLKVGREVVRRCASGDLGIWASHEKVLSDRDPRWKGSFKYAATLGRVAKQNIMNLRRNKYKAGSMQSTVESGTTELDEVGIMAEKYFSSFDKGAIVEWSWMDGSTGYEVNGIYMPAYPLDHDQGLRIANKHMTVVKHAFEPASNQARVEGDPHKYDGMSVAIGVIE